MSNASDAKAVWVDVEMSDLNEKSAKLYGTYRDASAKATNIRKDFEASFLAQAKDAGVVPEGMTIAFGYNFGKLAVAVVPINKPKSASKNAFRLKK